MKKFDIADIQFNGKGKFNHEKSETKIPDLYDTENEYEQMLTELHLEMDTLQNVMYAHNKYGMLVIFQAMDAAGKDGTMKAVFKNVHPLGISFYSFKRPSENELVHDYMWRCNKELPERGMIKIFNRSYYEEVLVVKVHPEILTNYQNLPPEITSQSKEVWENRYKDISQFEDYLTNNGLVVVKFFLNVSKKEQGQRLIERIEDINKNWKFQEGDIKERALWDKYMEAYEEMINKTATKDNPWYIVPADDKKNMRLIVAQVIVEQMKKLNMEYPKGDQARQDELKKFIDVINQQNQE